MYLGITYGISLQSVEQTKVLVITGVDLYDLIRYAESNYTSNYED